MKYSLLTALVLASGLAAPAYADPTVGLGLTVVFGGGQVDTGIGIRVFSNDKRDKAVASAGLDYMFSAKKVRGTVGVAYLGRNSYVGLDLGIGLMDGGVDFGLGVGGVNTKNPAVAAPPPPPPPPPPVALNPVRAQ